MKPILEVIADAVGDYEGADPVHDRLCAEHIVGHLRDAGYVIVPRTMWFRPDDDGKPNDVQ